MIGDRIVISESLNKWVIERDNALKRLEQLEKAFETLSKNNEKAMKELSKEIAKNRAFEIIKEKGVAVGFIQLLINDNLGGVNEYNDFIGDKKLYLTKEEFNLLKEILL